MTWYLNSVLELLVFSSAGNAEEDKRLSQHLCVFSVFPFLHFLIRACDLRVSLVCPLFPHLKSYSIALIPQH